MNKRKEKWCRQGAKLLKKYSKDGDVHNYEDTPPFWKVFLLIAVLAIRRFQKKTFFGKWIKWGIRLVMMRTKNWKDHHTMQYFEDGTRSVQTPQAKVIPVTCYSHYDVSIYRYTPKDFTPEDIQIMKDIWNRIIGTKYDYAQIMNIAINQILGYPFKQKTKILNPEEKKVCSVGVATVFQAWRKQIDKKVPRLFRVLNKSVWTDKFQEKFAENENRWSVENVYPSNFAVTETHFNGEFKLILKIRKGRIIYKATD
jgi:hypothetical protein